MRDTISVDKIISCSPSSQIEASIEQCPFPNFGDRKPEGIKPTMLILHHTAMKSYEETVQYF